MRAMVVVVIGARYGSKRSSARLSARASRIPMTTPVMMTLAAGSSETSDEREVLMLSQGSAIGETRNPASNGSPMVAA